MVKLGNLILPDDLIWEDEFSQTKVLASRETTISVDVVYFEQATSEGRNIDLVAYDNSGWLTRNQVLALQEMANTPGGIFQLEYGGEVYTVRFRHEDAPVLELTPVRPTSNPQNDDYYFGRIKLKEV